MSNSGPYPPMTSAENPPVRSVHLAGWHWPLRLHINLHPLPGEVAATLRCGRGLCGVTLAEIPEADAERGWALDPAMLADYAATHLPECKSGTVRHVF